jgi:RHS repeat-associated protein
MREKVTSYDSATVGSGNVVNEVVFEHNDLGQLVKEYQEHEGTKDASTLYVQYNFDDSATGGKFTKSLRPTSVRYPNGRIVHFTYGSSGGMADVLNRLDAIKDDSSGSPGDTLASYSYLGVGTIVKEDFEQPDVRLEYFFDSAYSGFDRFGRIVDQRWYDYGASADRDRYTYGYDRASNRLYRENATASGKDEFYTYDRVNRLVNSDRGDLNAGKTAISGTPVHEEDWNLDMTGNWSGYAQKTSGTTDLDQDRTHNEVNEITDISETTGTAWATPVHDRAGNMTNVPKPASLANSLSLKWDAWNRLVEAKDGEVVIGVYEYDALQRRVKRHVDSQAPDSPNGIDTYLHYFYNSAWQVLETRDTTTESDQPENFQPDWQYIWSPRYIDAPVLRDRNIDTDGLCDDERIYFLIDANFSVTTLVDTGGDAIERYLYAAYGNVTFVGGSWSNVRSTSSYANVVMYTGRERDAENGLYCYRSRYLHSTLGSFVGRDPDRFELREWNAYSYASENPIRYSDSLGLQATEVTPGANKQNCCDGWLRSVVEDSDVLRRGVVAYAVKQCNITICCENSCGGSETGDVVGHTYVSPGNLRDPNSRIYICLSRKGITTRDQLIAFLIHESRHVNQFVRAGGKHLCAGQGIGGTCPGVPDALSQSINCRTCKSREEEAYLDQCKFMYTDNKAIFECVSKGVCASCLHVCQREPRDNKNYRPDLPGGYFWDVSLNDFQGGWACDGLLPPPVRGGPAMPSSIISGTMEG